jgi:hypothetical protein
MFGFAVAYEPVALTFLVHCAPDLAQLVDDLLAADLLSAHGSLVTFASASGGVPDPGFSTFIGFELLVDHVTSRSWFFDGNQGF